MEQFFSIFSILEVGKMELKSITNEDCGLLTLISCGIICTYNYWWKYKTKSYSSWILEIAVQCGIISRGDLPNFIKKSWLDCFKHTFFKKNNQKELSSLNSKFYIQVRQKMSICHKIWILDSFLIDLAPQGTLRLNYYLPN